MIFMSNYRTTLILNAIFDPSQRIGQSLAFHLVQKMLIYAALQSQYGHFLTHAHRTYQLRNRLIAAPMAGITDRPFGRCATRWEPD